MEDLSFKLDELHAFKRTVIDSHSDKTIMPAFLRVMQAEQALMEQSAYEEDKTTAEVVEVSVRKRNVRGSSGGAIKPS